MRKLLAILTAAALLTLLGACGTSGGNDDAGSDETTTTAAADETTTAPEEEETTTTEAESDAVDVDEWAAGFCGSFSTWLDEIQAASSDVGSQVTAGDLESAQAAISTLFGTASDVTETLITDLEDLGAPDIDDGEQLVADLGDKFQGFVDAADTAQADTDALDLDPATFEEQANGLVERFQAEVSAVGDSFGEIDAAYPSPELNAAISESCDF
jgi:ABC-type glycerol-3-phosphate transport system substrate-binding protein